MNSQTNPEASVTIFKEPLHPFAKGYFVILFKYGNVDEPLINEIYTLIDNSTREMGIHDIPVEFGYSTYYNVPIPLSQDGVRQYNFGDRNVENLSESEIHVIEEYMKQKHESDYKRCGYCKL